MAARVGVIIAMSKEFEILKSTLQSPVVEHKGTKDYIVGMLGNVEVVMQQCGIGKVNAAVGATEMILAYQPDMILSTGAAGALKEYLQPQDVVVSESCTYHDVYCGEGFAKGQIQGLPAEFKIRTEFIIKAMCVSTRVHRGQIVSGDYFVDSDEARNTIATTHPKALAVDMESCALAHVCHIYNVPFVSLRIISDQCIDEDYTQFWATMAEKSFEVTSKFIEALP